MLAIYFRKIRDYFIERMLVIVDQAVSPSFQPFELGSVGIMAMLDFPELSLDGFAIHRAQ